MSSVISCQFFSEHVAGRTDGRSSGLGCSGTSAEASAGPAAAFLELRWSRPSAGKGLFLLLLSVGMASDVNKLNCGSCTFLTSLGKGPVGWRWGELSLIWIDGSFLKLAMEVISGLF